jgi:hypothetical protein
MFELRKSERKKAKIKLGMQGPSGSGKTYSSLLLAYGLVKDWKMIGVIDTENKSADLYANLGSYQVLELEAPFSPERFIQAIEVCEKSGIEVIIIDSLSAIWESSGGVLDIHGAMIGNSFSNWSKVMPRFSSFIQKMLQSNCHVIATIRSKQDWVLSEKNGKMIPEKIGLKGVIKDGIDYELTLVFEIDLKHQATASKDRTGLYMDRPSFMISSKTGQRIAEWCNSGTAEHSTVIVNPEPVPAIEAISSQIKKAATIESLNNLYQTHQKEWTQQLTADFTTRKRELVSTNITNLQNFSNNGNATPAGKAN